MNHEHPLDARLEKDLGTLDRADLRRAPLTFTHRDGARLDTPDRSYIDFSSNDYLGLAADPRIAQALADAALAEGVGAAASRLIAGTHALHVALEERIARFKGTEAALLFASGYAANTGAIPALAKRGDVILADELNHASLIDACRLSRAETVTFPHGDLGAVEHWLGQERGSSSRCWIVVDSVFSMDGDLFPLDRLVPLAKRHGAFIYVDDAHATGVLGANGRGSAEHFGVEGEIDVVMGTLGKGVGTAGAFIAGSQLLRDWLLNRARPFVFTTAGPPALAAATIAALDLIEREPRRRERLRANARRLRDGLAALGHRIPGEPDGHIVPVHVGEARETVAWGEALRSAGYLVGAVRPPTVPLGQSRLRITLSAAHDDGHIDGLLYHLERRPPPRRASEGS